MAQYPKIESIGSIGSIILAILEVQVAVCHGASIFELNLHVRLCQLLFPQRPALVLRFVKP